MHYVVAYLLLNIHDGQSSDYFPLGQPVELSTCLQIITDMPPQKPEDDNVKVFGCVREDVLGLRTS